MGQPQSAWEEDDCFQWDCSTLPRVERSDLLVSFSSYKLYLATGTR